MADDHIYTYDETQPLEQADMNVLQHLRRPQNTPVYLVSLPDNVATERPPSHPTPRTRNMTIVNTSHLPENTEQEEEPLQWYIRQNLQNFRKSLSPGDKEDNRSRKKSEDEGNVLVMPVDAREEQNNSNSTGEDGHLEETDESGLVPKTYHSKQLVKTLSNYSDNIPATGEQEIEGTHLKGNFVNDQVLLFPVITNRGPVEDHAELENNNTHLGRRPSSRVKVMIMVESDDEDEGDGGNKQHPRTSDGNVDNSRKHKAQRDRPKGDRKHGDFSENLGRSQGQNEKSSFDAKDGKNRNASIDKFGTNGKHTWQKGKSEPKGRNDLKRNDSGDTESIWKSDNDRKEMFYGNPKDRDTKQKESRPKKGINWSASVDAKKWPLHKGGSENADSSQENVSSIDRPFKDNSKNVYRSDDFKKGQPHEDHPYGGRPHESQKLRPQKDTSYEDSSNKDRSREGTPHGRRPHDDDSNKDHPQEGTPYGRQPHDDGSNKDRPQEGTPHGRQLHEDGSKKGRPHGDQFHESNPPDDNAHLTTHDEGDSNQQHTKPDKWRTKGGKPGKDSHNDSGKDGSTNNPADESSKYAVLKAPKSASSRSYKKRYHLKILQPSEKVTWFNARFQMNEDSNVDLDYEGPVKINNYYSTIIYK